MELENLCTLENLDEESVVLSLKKRYDDSLIYTNCGMILVSINPYKHVDLYGPEVAALYRSGIGCLQPHVYGLLEQCRRDQSLYGEHTIIINGDSGSGKTECARKILGYLNIPTFAHIDNILECLGNCKTKFNDNSSRFGKLIRLNSTVQIQTFLLEKSRVSEFAEDEQNFHVFYYILTGNDHLIKNDFINMHTHKESEKQVFSCKYKELVESFNAISLNFSAVESILLGIVYLGSVVIENEKIIKNDGFYNATKYLNINESVLEDFLLHTVLVVGNERIVKPLTQKDSYITRNSLARQLYDCLFTFVVNKINSFLASVPVENIKINILDIFGFENFTENGLDQFCINWCNERIHDHFVHDTFEHQRDILIREGVKLESLLDKCVIDNSSLHLIEMKVGLADLIDEESYINGNANNLQMKISNYMKLPIKPPQKLLFTHFNGAVSYSLPDFISKNRERTLIPSGIFNIKEHDEKSRNLTVEFIKHVKNTSVCSKSLVMEFKRSLNSLFDIIRNTRVKYIKCIRPNTTKTANSFDSRTVAFQLKNSGIFQTIELSKHLYPYTLSFQDFAEQYPFSDLNEKYLTKGRSHVFFNNDGFVDLERRLKEYKEMFRSSLKLFARLVVNKIQSYNVILSLKPMCEEEKQKDEGENKEDNLNNEKIAESEYFGTTDEHINHLEVLNKGKVICNEIIKQFEADIKEDLKIISSALNDNADKHTLSVEEENEQLKKIIKELQAEIETLKLCQKLDSLDNTHVQQMNLQNTTKLIKNKKVFEKVVFSSEISTEKTSMNLIFSSLIDLFLDHLPRFPGTKYDLDSVLCFAECVFCILTYSRTVKQDFESFQNELGLKLPLFQHNKNSVLFILSNLIELRGLLNAYLVGLEDPLQCYRFIANELDGSIKNMLDHVVALHNEAFAAVIPYCILDSEPLKKDKKHFSYIRRLFQGPSISKLIEHLDTVHGGCVFYHLPVDYVSLILRRLLLQIDQICFNSLLIRKKFLDFDKCYQIKYNLAEIEKFCFKIGMRELFVELSHISEAMKVASALARVELLAGEQNELSEITERAHIMKIVDESFLNEQQINALIVLFNYDTIEKLPDLTFRSKFISLSTSTAPAGDQQVHRSQFVEPKYLPAEELFKVLRFIKE